MNLAILASHVKAEMSRIMRQEEGFHTLTKRRSQAINISATCEVRRMWVMPARLILHTRGYIINYFTCMANALFFEIYRYVCD